MDLKQFMNKIFSMQNRLKHVLPHQRLIADSIKDIDNRGRCLAYFFCLSDVKAKYYGKEK